MIDAERDEVATGERARELYCGGVCRRAVLRELDHLGARDEAEERLGRLELEPRRANEVRAARELRGDRLDHRRVAVTERDGAQAHPVLDVLVPVDVPHVAARPALDDGRHALRELVDPLRVRVRSRRGRARAAPRSAHEIDRTRGPLRRPRPVPPEQLSAGRAPPPTLTLVRLRSASQPRLTLPRRLRVRDVAEPPSARLAPPPISTERDVVTKFCGRDPWAATGDPSQTGEATGGGVTV